MDHKTQKDILGKLDNIEKLLAQSDENSLNDFIPEIQASQILKRGKTWFWELRQLGFPFTKLGGQVYYNRKDLVRLLENNMENASPWKV